MMPRAILTRAVVVVQGIDGLRAESRPGGRPSGGWCRFVLRCGLAGNQGVVGEYDRAPGKLGAIDRLKLGDRR